MSDIDYSKCGGDSSFGDLGAVIVVGFAILATYFVCGILKRLKDIENSPRRYYLVAEQKEEEEDDENDEEDENDEQEQQQQSSSNDQ